MSRPLKVEQGGGGGTPLLPLNQDRVKGTLNVLLINLPFLEEHGRDTTVTLIPLSEHELMEISLLFFLTN